MYRCRVACHDHGDDASGAPLLLLTRRVRVYVHSSLLASCGDHELRFRGAAAKTEGVQRHSSGYVLTTKAHASRDRQLCLGTGRRDSTSLPSSGSTSPFPPVVTHAFIGVHWTSLEGMQRMAIFLFIATRTLSDTSTCVSPSYTETERDSSSLLQLLVFLMAFPWIGLSLPLAHLPAEVVCLSPPGSLSSFSAQNPFLVTFHLFSLLPLLFGLRSSLRSREFRGAAVQAELRTRDLSQTPVEYSGVTAFLQCSSLTSFSAAY